MITIVIPCKNEENYIGNLLQSIRIQNCNYKIIIADGGSTDSTIKIIKSFTDLNISIISGGLPAVGRNKGGFLCDTKYILFIDADAVLTEKLIKRALNKIIKTDSDLLTCNLNSNYFLAKIFYKITNLIIKISKLDKPFSTGVFFLIRTDVFKNLNGFPENAMHCEDYLLSRQINPQRFTILNQDVYTDNRRFKKMGHFNMIRYVFKNILNRNNIEYFNKNIGYWK